MTAGPGVRATVALGAAADVLVEVEVEVVSKTPFGGG